MIKIPVSGLLTGTFLCDDHFFIVYITVKELTFQQFSDIMLLNNVKFAICLISYYDEERGIML